MDCEIYWDSKLLLKGTEGEIYETLIRTAVFYVYQSWTIMNTDEGNLRINSFSSLSYDRPKASSKGRSPHSTI